MYSTNIDIIYVYQHIMAKKHLKMLFYIQYRLYICAVNNKNKDMKMDFKLRWVQLIALFCLIGVCSSCLDDDKREDWSETINLYVASQTADFYPQEFPSGIEPLEGIQVKENISALLIQFYNSNCVFISN